MTKIVMMAAGALTAAFGLAGPASAQLSQSGGPISYSAENMEYFDTEHRAVLTGNVDVVQNDSRLRADKITMFFSSSTGSAQSSSGLGSGDIERMIAEGEVYYVRPAQSARGDRAVYEVASDSVTFTGNVVVASAENVIRGNTMVLKITGRQTTIRPEHGQRVRGVFVPHGDQTAPGPNTAPQSTPGPGH